MMRLALKSESETHLASGRFVVSASSVRVWRIVGTSLREISRGEGARTYHHHHQKLQVRRAEETQRNQVLREVVGGHAAPVLRLKRRRAVGLVQVDDHHAQVGRHEERGTVFDEERNGKEREELIRSGGGIVQSARSSRSGGCCRSSAGNACRCRRSGNECCSAIASQSPRSQREGATHLGDESLDRFLGVAQRKCYMNTRNGNSPFLYALTASS